VVNAGTGKERIGNGTVAVAQGCANGGPGCPRIYIAYGVKDKLAPGIRILEAALPKGRVVALDGGHDWPVWKEGLMRLLRAGVLQ